MAALGIVDAKGDPLKREVPECEVLVLESNMPAVAVWSRCCRKMAIGMGFYPQPIETIEIKLVAELLEVDFDIDLLDRIRHFESVYNSEITKKANKR